MKDRESLFSEYVKELRNLAREASQKKKDFVDEKVMFYFRCWVGLEPQWKVKHLILSSAPLDINFRV